jgi:hypothetical protein
VRNQSPVAVISSILADEFWGSESPIGSTMERVWGVPPVEDQTPGNHMRKPPGTRVIGVVSDSMTQIDDHGLPTIYLPLDVEHMVVHMVVAAAGDPQPLVSGIRREVMALDPDQDPMVGLPRERLANALGASRSFALATGAIGMSALALAVIGLFGVTAFLVGQRRREIGIRLALGADGREVVGMLVRDSLRPVAIGLAAGVVLAFIAGQLAAGARLLRAGSGHDPMAIGAATLALLMAAGLAAFVPARRAARIDPAATLKLD